MSDEWEGYPQNPERDGIHLLRYRLTGHLTGWYWNAKTERFHHEHITLGRAALLDRYIYEGPILTPAEVAAKVDAARREEREACALEAERRDDGYHGVMGSQQRNIERAVSDAIAERIRARGEA